MRNLPLYQPQIAKCHRAPQAWIFPLRKDGISPIHHWYPHGYWRWRGRFWGSSYTDRFQTHPCRLYLRRFHRWSLRRSDDRETLPQYEYVRWRSQRWYRGNTRFQLRMHAYQSRCCPGVAVHQRRRLTSLRRHPHWQWNWWWRVRTRQWAHQSWSPRLPRPHWRGYWYR